MSFANMNKASWAEHEDVKVQGLDTAWKAVWRDRKARHMSQSVIARPRVSKLAHGRSNRKVNQGRKPNREGIFKSVQGSKEGSKGVSKRARTPRLWDYPGGYTAKDFGNDRVDGLGKVAR